jgi:tRNA (guanine-N7-)-methyltransferase
MWRDKLEKYRIIKNHPLILDFSWSLGGKNIVDWEFVFGNIHPLVLELACGRGEYTLWLSALFPTKNYIGIDIKAERFVDSAQKALKNWISHVRFVRMLVHHLESVFMQHTVNEIRLVHPDPRPKVWDAKRRLTHPRFLDLYKKILKPDGILRFKTDDEHLFVFSQQMLEQKSWTILWSTMNLYQDWALLDHHHGVVTGYERKAIGEGKSICYLYAKPPIL